MHSRLALIPKQKKNLKSDVERSSINGSFDFYNYSYIFSEERFDSHNGTSTTCCLACSKRRCERKEIITEIIETEIKYGRDLRIILEEFYQPMQVAGLLIHEQLSAIFLNVEELTEVNRQFTESLRDAIEIALDEGDEDLCTVKIGQIFKETEPMLGAFKSYCTRQVCKVV